MHINRDLHAVNTVGDIDVENIDQDERGGGTIIYAVHYIFCTAIFMTLA